MAIHVSGKIRFGIDHVTDVLAVGLTTKINKIMIVKLFWKLRLFEALLVYGATSALAMELGVVQIKWRVENTDLNLPRFLVARSGVSLI